MKNGKINLENYHLNVLNFYKLKEELIQEDLPLVKGTLQNHIKSYINLIEGAIYGVQLWSSFITKRYNPMNESKLIVEVYKDLIENKDQQLFI